MINALDEVKKDVYVYVKGLDFLGAHVAFDDGDEIITKDMKEFESFMYKHNYENGYGINHMNLRSVIYFGSKNGTKMWFTRGEYDGSEWWEINKIPSFYTTGIL